MTIPTLREFCAMASVGSSFGAGVEGSCTVQAAGVANGTSVGAAVGSANYELRCGECGKSYGNQPMSACPDCLAPLEVQYDLESVRGKVTRESIAAGPPNIWRYKALLPIPNGYLPDLPVGFTPLLKAQQLGKRIGATNLYVKNDAVCFPTLSFKDRVVSVALEAAKVLNTQVYGAHLVRIDGNYDHVNRLCTLIADEYNWGFVNVNLRPYYAEGSKTVGYEIAEQLGWRLPDNIVCPMAGGSLIRKIRKAFRELVELGLVEDKPVKFFGAQASGCSPISKAVQAGNDYIEPQKPNTIARSLAIGNPADGPAAAKMIQETGGWAEDVSDVEIVAGMQELAECEGIFTETAGGVTTAVTARLYAHGRIGADELTVSIISGNGLKTTDALDGRFEAAIPVKPKLAEFDAYLRARDVGVAESELVAAGGTR
jgi:threonine synthase